MAPIDWEREIEPGPFEDGRYQADWLCNRSTNTVRNALEQATESRWRLRTRLFSRSKRTFLDGFIGRLEEELSRRSQSGVTDPGSEFDTAALPAPLSSSEVLGRMSLDPDAEAKLGAGSARPIGEGPSFVWRLVPRFLGREARQTRKRRRQAARDEAL